MSCLHPARALAWLVAVAAVCSPSWALSADPEAAARGKLLYRIHCVACHGLSGTGDGPMVDVLKVRPADLTAVSRGNGGEFPFERTYRAIDGRDAVSEHGSRRMPVWGLTLGDAARADAQEDEVRTVLTDLVTYLESLQAATDE